MGIICPKRSAPKSKQKYTIVGRVILVQNQDSGKKEEEYFETNPKEILILSDASQDLKETSNKYIGKDKYFTID